jgi:hypothetical protein
VDRTVFTHVGPWAEDAYLTLRHDGRVEVVDGTLLIGPGAAERRSRVIERVREAVAAALPDGLLVIGPARLHLGPDCVLVPDLVVTATPDDEPADAAKADEKPMEAAAALMVIEVIGGEHGAIDRTFKPQLYARSGIPYSLLIDHDAPFALADMIIGGRYHEYAYAGGGEFLRIEEPFVLELDLDAATGSDLAPTAAPAKQRPA